MFVYVTEVFNIACPKWGFRLNLKKEKLRTVSLYYINIHTYICMYMYIVLFNSHTHFIEIISYKRIQLFSETISDEIRVLRHNIIYRLQ